MPHQKLAKLAIHVARASCSSQLGCMFYVGLYDLCRWRGNWNDGKNQLLFVNCFLVTYVWISIELFSNYESLSDLCDRRRIIESHGTVCPASRMGYRVTCVPCFSSCLSSLDLPCQTRNTEDGIRGAQRFLCSTLYGPAQHVP